ncbi:MAG: N-acetylmuramic acid 6-phosphate etherase [Flavobacteriaceae bacterium]|nr:N-acetylmuramic acid 6-phosphate etherase [Flavobacteriaceae bacterium]
MSFIKITEKDSLYNNLETWTTKKLIFGIHKEDKKINIAVEKVLNEIEKVIDLTVSKLSKGGRLFYIGAGTSGRIGILDASECPPTFGTNPNKVIGIIAGGSEAITNSKGNVENYEDDINQGWKDVSKYNISKKDIIIGIAASGTTPYVINTLKKCQLKKISTACLTSNPSSPITDYSDLSIEMILGPEFVTGSSRMKSGTAQKLILNMISTCTMIKLGHIKDNKMIDMQTSNSKLKNRASKILMNALSVSETIAKNLIEKHKSVRIAIKEWKKK